MMTLPRFYVEADLKVGQAVLLPASIAHHALRVLRLRDGATITLFNGRGGEYDARLAADGARATAHLERFDPIERESPLQATLVQAWVAAEKLEFIVEKAVELGAASFVFVPTARSVVQLAGKRLERRLQRLKDIAVAACCQSGRNRIPDLVATATLDEGLALALGRQATGILLDPHNAHAPSAMLSGSGPFSLVVGPEGGLDDVERELATRMGYRRMRLGPRILRTETAGLAGLVTLQLLGGDLR